MTVLIAFLRPFLPYIAWGLAGFLGLSAAYWKVRHDEKVRVMQQIEKEKSDAIAKANEARRWFLDACSRAPDCRLPDSWFRD
jgi:hypothetical protein